MPSYTIILKNNLGSELEIEDLGIFLAPSSTTDITGLYVFTEIASSRDLYTAVLAGDVTINDGSDDLSISDGIDYISIKTVKGLKDDYYDKPDIEDYHGQHSYAEITRTNNKVTKIEAYNSAAKTYRTRTTELTRTGNFVSEVEDTFYGEDGTSISRIILTTLTRDSSNKVTSVSSTKEDF